MNKTELEEAIKNGESVWVVKDITDIERKIIELKLNDITIQDKGCFVYDNLGFTDFYSYNDIYKSKAEAEHYLHHTNITRTEELPFLTWGVFLEEKKLYFYDFGRVLSKLFIYNNKIILSQAPDSGDWDVLKPMRSWDLTEQNFYKAYDECIRLFKGE